MPMIELLALPDGIGPELALVISLAAAVTSFISAVAGLGGGTILLGLMATFLPPLALIPVHGVVQLGSNFFRTILLFPQARREVLLPFVAGSALGSVTSGMIIINIPPWLIQYGIACFIIWSVFGNLPSMGRGHIFVAGTTSGFLTMLFGATGPFVGAFIKTFNLQPASHIATQAMLMTMQHLLKLIVFGLLGFAFVPYILLIGMMLFSGFVGTIIGKSTLLKINEMLFKKIVNVVLLILAVRLIWLATTSVFI